MLEDEDRGGEPKNPPLDLGCPLVARALALVLALALGLELVMALVLALVPPFVTGPRPDEGELM